jgi:single-strand DNA-binding protein
MYQKIIIIGRLGADPEMRYTSGGAPVTSFSVATDRVWTDANNQRQEKTIWFRVSAWKRLAEICNQYLSKGRLVMVEGEIQEPRVFQGRDGEWRASLDIMARDVKFLGGREGGAPAGAAGATGAAGAAGAAGPSAHGGADDGPNPLDEEEIPF